MKTILQNLKSKLLILYLLLLFLLSFQISGHTQEAHYVWVYSHPENVATFTGVDGLYYYPGQTVIITAQPIEGVEFTKWVTSDLQEITDNPYIFTMPDEDVILDAYFDVSFPIVVYSIPMQWEWDTDPNTNIYLTFNKNIALNNTENYLDNIVLTKGYGAETEEININNIYLISNKTLAIEPQLPLAYNSSFTLFIPKEAIQISGSPELIMNEDYYHYFDTGFGNFQTGEITPDYKIYGISTPSDVDFNINWGDENEISNFIYYYWDDLWNYHEIELVEGTDYIINENILTIKNSFISSLSLEEGEVLNFSCMFGSGLIYYFNIEIADSYNPYIDPEELSYDLFNPHDLFSFIFLNNAQSVTSISYNSSNLVENVDFEIIDYILIIKNSFLNSHLQNVGQEIQLKIKFNNDFESYLTITAIQTNITNATISPQFFEIQNILPEYFDITITWNDATSVTGLTVCVAEDDYINVSPYEYYDVIPIDSETATLRIYTDVPKSSNTTKAVDEQTAIFRIDFDMGAITHCFFYISMEYYDIELSQFPAYGGSCWYDGNNIPNSILTLYAEASSEFTFSHWSIDNTPISYENPFEFIMPANDVYITANFLPAMAEVFTVELNANPVEACTLIGAGNYMLGANLTIKAIPEPGYQFLYWTNETDEIESTNPNYNFSVMGDRSFTAHFDDISNISTENNKEINVYPNPFNDNLFITNIESVNKITITTITGQIIAEYQNIHDNQINTSMLTNGFYLIVFDKNDGSRCVNKITKQ